MSDKKEKTCRKKRRKRRVGNGHTIIKVNDLKDGFKKMIPHLLNKINKSSPVKFALGPHALKIFKGIIDDFIDKILIELPITKGMSRTKIITDRTIEMVFYRVLGQ